MMSTHVEGVDLYMYLGDVCQRRGHFICPQRSVNVVDDEDDQGELFVDIVDRKTEEVLVNSVHSDWIHPLMVNGCIVPCKLIQKHRQMDCFKMT